MNKKNFKTIFIALIAVLIFVAFIWLSIKQIDDKSTGSLPVGQGNQSTATSTVEQIKAIFNCPDGRFIQATFNNGSASSVDLILSDGRSISLPQTISASGARYANTDESFVFWNKGDSAFIEENGTTTFDNCFTGQNQAATTSAESIIYTNNDYGFNFTLPVSWQGYTLLRDTWKGYAVSETQGQSLYTQGQELLIRHPLWTSDQPRQDIPVMIFTLAQWNDLQADKFHIGAAPIGPSELGRNAKYVFALPARYNFVFPVGYEEVDKIIQSQPIKVF